MSSARPRVTGHLRNARRGLRAGGRLPSSHNLAAELGVSRRTVTIAYEPLAVEGFIKVRQRGRRAAVPPPQDLCPAPRDLRVRSSQIAHGAPSILDRRAALWLTVRGAAAAVPRTIFSTGKLLGDLAVASSSRRPADPADRR